MARSRQRPPAARSLAPERTTAAGEDTLLCSFAVAAACVVFWGALKYFFAQDDFTGIARARGLMPPLMGPWRWISGQFYFEALGRIAGLDPLPYRIVSLAAHGVCVALVYRLCRRFVPPLPAAAGAVFFGAHPAHYTALYSISGIGEILAAGFGLAALLVSGLPGRRAWWAPPLFAVSLLSKESTLLLPLVALSPAFRPSPRTGDPTGGPRHPIVPLTLCLMSLVYLATFLERDVFGMRSELAASAPYALRFDRTLADNLLSYLGWTVRIALPAVRSFVDAVDRNVFGDGLVVGLVALIGLAVRELRARGWREAFSLYMLTLLPVLPLVHHTYHYYLYAPLAGAALGVAALADVLTVRLASRGAAPIARVVVAGVALVLVVNGALLVRKIEHYPFSDPELRSDPTVDRARIAANAIADLRGTHVPPGTRLWFWSPASIERQRASGRDGEHESYWESNVRTALYDGLAARLFVPELAGTRFVRRFEPAGDSVRYAVYLPNGHLRIGTPAELDSVLRHSPVEEPPTQ